jgi:inosose dehydratase
MKVQLANSPDSWGVWFPSEPRQVPWQRYLDEVCEAGYTGTELGPYGYLPTNSEQLRTELSARGLQLTGGFVMLPLEDAANYDRIASETMKIADLVASAGAGFLVLIDGEYRDLASGVTTAPSTLGDEDWKQLVETADRLGEAVQSRCGLRLCFHPHADTHVEYEAQAERFVTDTDPAYVSICLDLGHFEYRGGDAVRFFQKHSDRIPYFHFKSVDSHIRAQVDAESLAVNEAVKRGVFCEPDKGTVDYPSLARSLEALNFEGWATVEQDRDPESFEEALGSARRTLRYFQGLGLAMSAV